MSNESKVTKSPKKLGLWLCQIVTWFNGILKSIGPYIPIFAAAVAICLIDNFTDYYKEIGVRFVGMIFQVIGFFLVFQQLEDRLRIFRKPTFLSAIINYIRSFPSRKSRAYSVSAQSLSSVSTLGALSSRARLVPSKNSSLDRRVKILEGEIENVRKELVTMERTFNEYKSGNEKSIEKIRQENNKKFKKFEEVLDKAFIGGIHIERVGIWYFLVGVILATAAPEITILTGYAE